MLGHYEAVLRNPYSCFIPIISDRNNFSCSIYRNLSTVCICVNGCTRYIINYRVIASLTIDASKRHLFGIGFGASSLAIKGDFFRVYDRRRPNCNFVCVKRVCDGALMRIDSGTSSAWCFSRGKSTAFAIVSFRWVFNDFADAETG